MPQLRIHLMLLLVASACATGGCASLAQSACDVASPAVQKAQIYGDDAEVALHRVTVMFASMKLDPEARAEVDAQLARAWDALRAAQAALLAASDACKGVDALTVFSDFVQVWKAIEALLLKHSDQLQAPASGSELAPQIVRKAEGR